MLEIAKSRCPNSSVILSDMCARNLHEKFACIIAWHIYFHLSQNDQRTMFETFVLHLIAGGVLRFTTESEEGERWGDNGGEHLYHVSRSPVDYKELLKQQGFVQVEYKKSDPKCGKATFWQARLYE